ncbi:protein MIS12 homolog isoform X1 [Prunus yedoensis var. nudiflora]|uniref:Protein MIS12 homolog isoform X1 n=1 Tax=Prunus yedoensis var. nudiflora TaxID=2094558 RepID=A0A314UUT1_PRUYE|nr:protein MIS12 homolog isoform X1 [Prunus yedoensis var. nudiflora]
MEGSESEAVFDSLNVNPQLFINEVFNLVDDLVDDACNHFHQQASTSLKIEGTDRTQDLSKGITVIRKKVQSDIDKRLAMWEQHCHNHFFQVPEGFMLPKSDETPVDTSICQNAICDPDLDAQLDLLRNNLTKVGKESAALNRELKSLERQSASNDHISALNEISLLYDQNSYHEMFQEMMKTASEFRTKIGKLKTRKIEETEHNKADKIYNPRRDPSMMGIGKGFFGAKLEDLQEVLVHLKNSDMHKANVEHDATGRLLKFDPQTKEVTVLLRGLSLPLGTAVSKHGSFVLVSE